MRLLATEGRVQHTNRYKFFSDWGFHIVLAAVALPLVGLAYFTWTVLPAEIVSHPAPAPILAAQPRALDVIAAFRSAGLRAEIIAPVSKDERDGLSTFMVVDSRIFRISDNDKAMGMVLTFKNQRDLEKMQNYLLSLNGSLPQFRSWVFVKDNVLLQINREVPEHKAGAYAEVLDTLEQ